MAVVSCPYCGRYNVAEDLEARGFACELCRQTIPKPDGVAKDAPPRSDLFVPPQQPVSVQTQPSSHTLPASPAVPGPQQIPSVQAPPRKGPYPVSRVCPSCGHAEYRKERPERLVAFTWDRVCRACQTRYTPPTPTWAAFVFLLAGFPLAAFGLLSVVAGFLSGNALGIPAIMACEGFLGILGVLAMVQGVRALANPGRV